LSGAEMEVLAVTTERDWYQVDAGGETGWILADTVRISGNSSVIEIVEKPTATFTATPTATDTDTPEPTATPTDTVTPTEPATHTPQPSSTSTGTPDIPPPFTPTPTFGSSGTEVAEDELLTPEQEREFASRLPFRMELLMVDNFESNVNGWEGVGSTVNGGALELVSQGEFAGFAESRNIPVTRDFYVSVDFVGSSDIENYALALWFRFQEDESGYVVALDNKKFVQVGFTSEAGYEQLDEVADLNVDFTQPTRLSVMAVGEFLEIYVNGQYIKTVKLDHSNTPGTVELGVYTFEPIDPTVTVYVEDFRLFGLNLQPPLTPENVVLGTMTSSTSLMRVPDGRLTPRRLLRG
ncbi:MAG: hypothetical protein K8I82_10395, partial [Anaerolineae bacterium]|nr:hypothetical protein [Anaerolineae bacterium]